MQFLLKNQELFLPIHPRRKQRGILGESNKKRGRTEVLPLASESTYRRAM